MFSKLYKELYYQRWFRQLCMTTGWHTMRNNPFTWNKEQTALDRIFGKRPIRSPRWES